MSNSIIIKCSFHKSVNYTRDKLSILTLPISIGVAMMILSNQMTPMVFFARPKVLIHFARIGFIMA